MARYALILPDGTVESVIVAEQSFIDGAPASWRARYAAIELADTNAEPGAGYNEVTNRFVRPVAGRRWDPVTRTMVVDPDYVPPPPTLEERIAALEAAGR
jgi:hypothetical protein